MPSSHPSPWPSEGQEAISREELRARLNDASLALVNVLPATTFADGHIPGSVNLPLAELRQRARAALPNLEQEIAVYCGSFT